MHHAEVGRGDSSNVHVYMSNICPGVSDAELWQLFGLFGDVKDVKTLHTGDYAVYMR